MSLLAALRASALAVSAALLALMLHLGQPGETWWWLSALPFALWVCGPALLLYAAGHRGRRHAGFVAAMLAVLAGSSLAAAIVYHRAFFVSTSSTAALALVFVPLWQWLAALLAILIGAIVLRLRRRG